MERPLTSAHTASSIKEIFATKNIAPDPKYDYYYIFEAEIKKKTHS